MRSLAQLLPSEASSSATVIPPGGPQVGWAFGMVFRVQSGFGRGNPQCFRDLDDSFRKLNALQVTIALSKYEL